MTIIGLIAGLTFSAVSVAAADETPITTTPISAPKESPPAAGAFVSDASDEVFVAAYAAGAGISLAAARQQIPQEDAMNNATAAAGIAPDSDSVDVWIERRVDGLVLHVRTDRVVEAEAITNAAQRAGVPLVIDRSPALVMKRTAQVSQFSSQLVEAIPGLQEYYIDVATGQLMLDVYDEGNKTAVMAASQSATRITGLPSVATQIDSPVRQQSTVNGGVALTECTAGFTGTYTSGSTTYQGFFTAAHCDQLGMTYYYGAYQTGTHTTATFKTGTESANADIAFYAVASGDTVSNQFYGQSTTVPTTQGSIVVPNVGSNICHQGYATGYACGTLASLTVALPNVWSCGGHVCNQVYGKVGYISKKGDSGGPVWYGTNGLIGIHSSGDTSDFTTYTGFFSQLKYRPAGTNLK